MSRRVQEQALQTVGIRAVSARAWILVTGLLLTMPSHAQKVCLTLTANLGRHQRVMVQEPFLSVAAADKAIYKSVLESARTLSELVATHGPDSNEAKAAATAHSDLVEQMLTKQFGMRAGVHYERDGNVFHFLHRPNSIPHPLNLLGALGPSVPGRRETVILHDESDMFYPRTEGGSILSLLGRRHADDRFGAEDLGGFADVPLRSPYEPRGNPFNTNFRPPGPLKPPERTSFAHVELPPKVVYDPLMPGYASERHEIGVTAFDLVLPLVRRCYVNQDRPSLSQHDLFNSMGLHALHERDHTVLWDRTIQRRTNSGFNFVFAFDRDKVSADTNYYVHDSVYGDEGWATSQELYTYLQQYTRTIHRQSVDILDFAMKRPSQIEDVEQFLWSLLGGNRHWHQTISESRNGMGARLGYLFEKRATAALRRVESANWNDLTIELEAKANQHPDKPGLVEVQVSLADGEKVSVPVFVPRPQFAALEKARAAKDVSSEHAVLKPFLVSVLKESVTKASEATKLYSQMQHEFEEHRPISKSEGKYTVIYDPRHPNNPLVKVNPDTGEIVVTDYAGFRAMLERTIQPAEDLAARWENELLDRAPVFSGHPEIRYPRLSDYRPTTP